jgi:hypothetical protein
MKYKLDVKNPIGNLTFIELTKLKHNNKHSSNQKNKYKKKDSFFADSEYYLNNKDNRNDDGCLGKSSLGMSHALNNRFNPIRAANRLPSKPNNLNNTNNNNNKNNLDNKTDDDDDEHGDNNTRSRKNNNQNSRSTSKYDISNSKSSKKSLQHRHSIVPGKHMSVMHACNKHSKRYRRLQMIVYNFLERPSGKFAAFYQIFM